MVRWADGTNDSATKRLMFQVFFLIISDRLRALKTLYFHFCKKKWKGFCIEFRKILWKKNNAWNFRRFVNESFVPLAERTSVLYCRLTDFISMSRSYFRLQLATKFACLKETWDDMSSCHYCKETLDILV